MGQDPSISSQDSPEVSEPDESSPTRTGRSSWIVVTSIGAIVVALMFLVVFASRFGSDPDYVASAVINRQMPSLELERLGVEGTLNFDELRGDVVVFNFWASWCTSCREEHPGLIRTAAAYESFGVRFIGVSFQDRDDAAIAMLDELGWGYDYVVDRDSRAAIAFGVRGVPETYFVDRDGMIRARIYGKASEAMLSNQLDLLLLESLQGD